MAGYLGNTQKISGSYTVDEFTSSGGTTYTLTKTPGAKNNIQVSAGGLVQYPSAYSVSGTTLTLSGVPSGQKVVVRHMGDTIPYPILDANSVDSAELVAGSVDDAHLATGISASKLTGALPAISGASLTNLPAGGDTRNFIIDGDFTQWPDGTAATTNSSWKSALWYGRADIGTVEFSRSTDVPTVAQSNHRSSYSFKVDCTATGSVASGTKLKLYYWITGSDYAHIHKQAFVFSFWVKSYQTGIHTVGFQNSGGTRSYVAEYTVSSSATWERKTIAVPAESSDSGWLFTEADKGMGISFSLASGSTYNTTAGSWAAGNYNGSSNTQNITSSTSNEIYISQLMLTLGTSAPSAFLGESIGTVRDQVERYVEEWSFDSVSNEAFPMPLYFRTTAAIEIPFQYRTRKRATPSLTFTANSTFNIVYGGGSIVDGDGNSPGTQDIGKSGCIITMVGANAVFTAGQTGRIRRDSTDTTKILISARH